jgi:hypothetical protein
MLGAGRGTRFAPTLKSVIYGLTYANNAGDATNDLDIAAGGAMDSTGAYWMTLSAAITKQLDAAWAVGTNAGGLDTGAVGNSDYYIWLIKRSDTGVVDALYSLSSTAPTMPTNYDYKRLIGWFKRVGGTIVAFHTYETEGGGIEVSWDVPTLDVNLAEHVDDRAAHRRGEGAAQLLDDRFISVRTSAAGTIAARSDASDRRCQ